LNQINTIFYGGYLLGQIPNNLIMQKVRPGIWLPTTCMAWGLLTLGTAFVHHPWQIMVIRFFQGIFEASCFVGVQWILGSWYKPEEIGKRTAIFTSSGLAGTLFSGIMQGGIHKSLDGAAGFAGWRWLFVIDSLITFPIAAYGFLCFPDTPTSTKARYFSEAERALAVSRLPEVKLARGQLGTSLIRRVVLSWQWWAFVLLWIACSNTEMYSSNAIFQLLLQHTGDYSVEQTNYIPSSVSGMGIVATLILGWYTDWAPKRRWHVGVLLSITAAISGILMLTAPTRAGKFAALVINGMQFSSQAVAFAWANDVLRDDDAKRAVVLASMNMFAQVFYMFWSILFYNAQQAPNWFEGNIAMIVMGGCVFATTMACWYLQRRDAVVHGVGVMGGERDGDGDEKGAAVVGAKEES
jgi:ACS family pantothenate transporter-like MFS transporter